MGIFELEKLLKKILSRREEIKASELVKEFNLDPDDIFKIAITMNVIELKTTFKAPGRQFEMQDFIVKPTSFIA